MGAVSSVIFVLFYFLVFFCFPCIVFVSSKSLFLLLLVLVFPIRTVLPCMLILDCLHFKSGCQMLLGICATRKGLVNLVR